MAARRRYSRIAVPAKLPELMRSSVLLSAVSLLLIGAVPATSAKEKLDNENVAGDAYSDPQLRPEILPGPEVLLPDKPEDIAPKMQPIATDPDTVLKGGADTTSLVSKAEFMPDSPLSRYRGDKLVFFKVRIRNDGQNPVLVLGRDAQIAESKTIRAAALENHDNTLLTPKEKALVAAVGIGSAGLASSLFYEHMTPDENRHRNLGLALGRDRGRHEVESENLGTRYVMPGDETVGWLAFEDGDHVRGSNRLKLPVMFPPYSAVSANLSMPIAAPLLPPAPSDKKAR